MLPTRCLFVVQAEPITPDTTGGTGPLYYSHLELLAASGCEIVLLLLAGPDSLGTFDDFIRLQPDVWATVKSWCASYHVLEMKPGSGNWSQAARFLRTVINPASAYVDSYNGALTSLRETIDRQAPQFIWAEHLLPATVVEQASRTIPIIYSHHDWKWRIKTHRAGVKANDWRKKWTYWLSKRHQEGLVRRVAACVSASASEAAEIRALGGRQVAYFPATYRAVDPPPPPLSGRPRIVHLGGMRTTANRIGLQRFMEVSWPIICRNLPEPPELWVIGSLAGISGSLLAQLQDAGAVCTGFVADLATVLRPFDLHIVPWEHNTGTRTRIPLVLNYAQVLVSTAAGAACLPELHYDQNCVLTPDLPAMAWEILDLIADCRRRQRLAEAGREAFLAHFTRESLQPRFNQFLASVLPPVAGRRACPEAAEGSPVDS